MANEMWVVPRIGIDALTANIKTLVESTCDSIIEQVVQFERSLDSEHEIALRVIDGPNSQLIHVHSIEARNPNLIVFTGMDADARSVQVVQSMSRISLMLAGVPKQKEVARRIGFY